MYRKWYSTNGAFLRNISPPYEKRNDRFSLNKLSDRQTVEIFGVPRLGQTHRQTDTQTDSLTKKTEHARRYPVP